MQDVLAGIAGRGAGDPEVDSVDACGGGSAGGDSDTIACITLEHAIADFNLAARSDLHSISARAGKGIETIDGARGRTGHRGLIEVDVAFGIVLGHDRTHAGGYGSAGNVEHAGSRNRDTVLAVAFEYRGGIGGSNNDGCGTTRDVETVLLGGGRPGTCHAYA